MREPFAVLVVMLLQLVACGGGGSDTSPRMSISLDDRTVFVAGPAQVIIQPVP